MHEAIDGWMMDVSCNSLLDITLYIRPWTLSRLRLMRPQSFFFWFPKQCNRHNITYMNDVIPFFVTDAISFLHPLPPPHAQQQSSSSQRELDPTPELYLGDSKDSFCERVTRAKLPAPMDWVGGPRATRCCKLCPALASQLMKCQRGA